MTGVGAGIATATAGCMGDFDPSRITSVSFEAGPVVLAPDPAGIDYRRVAMTEETIERNPQVAGAGVEVELTNHAAVYESLADTLGLLASPDASVASRSVNPLASDPVDELLASDVGEEMLRSLGVVEQSTVTWVEGPEQVGGGEGELLGQPAAIRSFAGVTEGSGFLLVTAARVTDAGDVVVAANTQQRDGDAGELVGEAGYVSRSEVTASVDRFASTLPRVERDLAGLRLGESALLDRQEGSPGYVRVRLENTHDTRRIQSATLVSQFFDAEGELLDAGTARVPTLEPGETHEGYLPYFSGEVAGYAVEATQSTRETPAEPPESVEVTSSSLEGDTVTAVVRNTGGETAVFVDLAVTFYDEEGTAIATRHRHVDDLREGQRREFRTAHAPSATEPPVSIDDYAVELVRFDDSALYAR